WASRTIRQRHPNVKSSRAQRAGCVHDDLMMPTSRADALMELLFPLWQLVIGAVVAVVVAVVALPVVHRGRSRMGTAMVVTALGIVGLALLGILQAAASRP